MNIRTFVGWVAVAIAAAMPLTVVSMTQAYFDNGTARATVSSRESEVRRLSELGSDVRILTPVFASAILARHGVRSIEGLDSKLNAARNDLAVAQGELKHSSERLWRASVIGFLCVAATSWAALSLATVWPPSRRAQPVTA
jgi:hypothetical protein